MGKTGLIHFCYSQPQIQDEYYTFFIDILHTSNLREFTFLLGKEIYQTLQRKGKNVAEKFLQTIKSISASFGFDPLVGSPTFNLQLGDISHPEYTLREIFNYLSSADKRCIVAIDEFQQIARYPEKNIEALLRTYIQQQNNTNFVFAGSEKHILQEMFSSEARPFYQSADIMELKAIDKSVYCSFVVEMFERRNRKIELAEAEKVYDLFDGHTYYMQKTFNEAFADTAENEQCTTETISTAIDNIVEQCDTIFREILSNVSEKQKILLYAIAKDGKAQNITSANFIAHHRLPSASSVQSAAKKLLTKDLISQNDKTLQLTDKLLAMWIRKEN